MGELLMILPSLAGIASVAQAGLRIAQGSEAAGLARLLGAAFPEHDWSTDRAPRDLQDDASVVETWVIDGPNRLLATTSAPRPSPSSAPAKPGPGIWSINPTRIGATCWRSIWTGPFTSPAPQ